QVSPGEFVEFLLGFRNNEEQKRKFSIVVKFNKGSSPVHLDDPLTLDESGKAEVAPVYFDKEVSLDPNEDEFQWLGLAMPSGVPMGEYFYDVYVCYNGGAYEDYKPPKGPCPSDQPQLYSGSKQRLFVNVR
ncbi:hypothetical protein KY327_04115, partial [Candidatus Woesearchaeota archaeon]|nr:hypothetical protein [Candidatus Woesearchaeota archaeon]